MATEMDQPQPTPQNAADDGIRVIADNDLTNFIGTYVAGNVGKSDDWDEWEGGRKVGPKAITFAITLICIPEPDDTRDVFAQAVADDLRAELIQLYHVPAITLVGMVDTDDPGDGTTEQPQPTGYYVQTVPPEVAEVANRMRQIDIGDDELQDIP